MKVLKEKRFYRFLLPSLVGAFLFVTPINQGGNLTIPIAVVANKLLDILGDTTLTIIWVLISLSAVITILHKAVGIRLLKKNHKMDSLFSVKGFWFVVRMIGFVFANMIYFNFGPDFVIGDLTGGLVINDLIPILICVFFLAGPSSGAASQLWPSGLYGCLDDQADAPHLQSARQKRFGLRRFLAG